MISQNNELTHVVREWAEVFMNRSMRTLNVSWKIQDYPSPTLNILMRLFHGGICGVSEIGESMGITNAAASQTVERLVQMGLIKRTEHPKDRRAKQLELTHQGRDLIEKGVDARSSWIKNLTESLSQKDQELVTSALIILTSAARKTEK